MNNKSHANVIDEFRLKDQVVVITGGGGLLGVRHAQAVLEAGGIAILLDKNNKLLEKQQTELSKIYPEKVIGFYCDITKRNDVEENLRTIVKKFGRIDALINNAANDPKVGNDIGSKKLLRFENISLDVWHADIDVGLTGAFICCQVIGGYMADNQGGVILNIASDLAIIAPDQRIYCEEGLLDEEQPTKPVTYSVVKSGLVGLTKYLCTYWAAKNIRVNVLCPGGVYNGQGIEFVQRLTNLIPLSRMADKDEYKAAVVFLLSDASRYMTGASVIMDGGRTVW